VDARDNPEPERERVLDRASAAGGGEGGGPGGGD
jgi:hypothetical protein